MKIIVVRVGERGRVSLEDIAASRELLEKISVEGGRWSTPTTSGVIIAGPNDLPTAEVVAVQPGRATLSFIPEDASIEARPTVAFDVIDRAEAERRSAAAELDALEHEDTLRRAEEAQARKREAEEAERQRLKEREQAEEAARQRAEDERERAAEEERARIAAEEEAARLAEEEARRKAEEEERAREAVSEPESEAVN